MDKIFKVERDILLYALRYVIGRQTFAPTIVIENIKANIGLFSEGDLQMIIRDIKSKEIYGYGMECDKQQWFNFIEYLECFERYCKDCYCMDLEDSKDIDIRHKFEQRKTMSIDIRDLKYLISMTYGYIDDELGGMESNTKHANRLSEIMDKYGVK